MAKTAQVLVTNRGALEAKYGERFQDVWQAIEALAASDEQQRNLPTRIVALDDAATMDELGGAAVGNPADPAANKAAVDAVYRALTPDYICIVGAVDVVPHQDLANPLAAKDGDPTAAADLPYACDAPYGTEISSFVGPTRVVGRLPDVTGSNDADRFKRILGIAQNWTARGRDDYLAYLGVSADVWRGSTELSLTNVFGAAADLQPSPTEGPDWTSPLLSRRSHFINCHGAPADPHYYGQQGRDYPVAHSAEKVAGQIEGGTVLAAECCYGAELYDPVAAGGQASICNTYLEGGAYGVFGSSTVAYGPANGNANADVICQAFLRRVLAGSSLGRAALEARQEFVASAPVLSPMDLKTLAQFSLMGHPSIAPVQAAPGAEGVPKAFAAAVDQSAQRASRRRNLMANGLALVEATSYAEREASAPGHEVRAALDELQKQMEMPEAAVLSYEVEPPPIAAKAMFAAPVPQQAFHVLVESRGEGEGPIRLRAIVAKEEESRIVFVQEVYAK